MRSLVCSPCASKLNRTLPRPRPTQYMFTRTSFFTRISVPPYVTRPPSPTVSKTSVQRIPTRHADVTTGLTSRRNTAYLCLTGGQRTKICNTFGTRRDAVRRGRRQRYFVHRFHNCLCLPTNFRLQPCAAIGIRLLSLYL
jgi:hypothetical protein